MADQTSRLGLGSVQFGLDYAIDMNQLRPDDGQVAEILAAASTAGLGVIDTARAYGNAEAVLGRTLPEDHRFRIVTKTPAFEGERIRAADAALLIEQFRASLRDLRIRSVDGLLVHKAENLLGEGGEHLFEAMEALRQEGAVDKIGVSVYTADQIGRVIARFPIDLIQVPVSVLDQRLIAGGQLRELKRHGVEIHARSIFLKGLIFENPDDLPPYFNVAKSTLRMFQEHVDACKLDAATAALSFVLGVDEIDTVLVGVTNLDQLNGILNGIQENTGKSFTDPAKFAISDPDILNPAKWPEFETTAL